MTNSIEAPAPMSFDPAAEMSFGEDYGEYVPPIEKPEDYDQPAPLAPPLPSAERIAATFRGMPGTDKLLYHLIDYCREPCSSEQVHAEAVRFVGSGVCTYAPEVVCANLVRAGALEIIPDEAANAEAAASTAGGAAGTGEAAEAPAFGIAAEEFADGGAAPVGESPAFSYGATAAGLAAVDARDPEGDRLRFLEEGERYLPVYRLVLEMCGDADGATKKAIDGVVDHHPLCRDPRRYSGFFVKGLESIDAIAFDGAWKTTEVGRSLLDGAAFAENE